MIATFAVGPQWHRYHRDAWPRLRHTHVETPASFTAFQSSHRLPLVVVTVLGSAVARAASRRDSSSTLSELREECRSRGLPTAGSKFELLQRLQEVIVEVEVDVFPPGTPIDVRDDRPFAVSHEETPQEPDNLIRPGDRIFLRAHTGCYFDVDGQRVQARWEDMGKWQGLIIEKSPLVIETSDSDKFHSGDLIFLRAHTGVYVDVESDNSPVNARWNDLGTWQGLVLVKEGEGPLSAGDTIFLKAHTGTYIDVQRESVQARWADEGKWQALIITR